MKRQINIIIVSIMALCHGFFSDVNAQIKNDSIEWNKARAVAFRNLNGVGVELNYKKAYVIFRSLAEKGDIESTNALGMMYKQGLGVKQDEDKAVSYFTKAAEGGSSKGMYNLALAYRYGSGIEQNPQKAFDLLVKARELGSKTTDYPLGYLYYKGIGVKQDYQTAIKYFSLGAEKGNPACMFNLGLCYFRGRGVERDRNLGKQWIEKAALKGFSRAIDFIARVDSKTYGMPKIRTRALDASALEAQIPPTHQRVTMPNRNTQLRSSSNQTANELSGQWTGKIITYDWSGREIEEEIDLEVFIDADGDHFQGLWIENGNHPIRVNAELGDSSWAFTNTVLRENARPLEMRNGSLVIEQKADQKYLIGNLYFYSEVTREYTAPNYVILTRKQPSETNDISTELVNNETIVVYPNPFMDKLTIELSLDSEQALSVSLFNMSGEEVYAKKGGKYMEGKHILSISTSSYAKGAYILNISAGNSNKSLILTK